MRKNPDNHAVFVCEYSPTDRFKGFKTIYHDPMTMLVSSIFIRDALTVTEAMERAQRATRLGARLIEWRIDELAETPQASRVIQTLLADSPAPCILTCRPHWEGGLYEEDDESRIELMKESLECGHPPKYIDLELRTLQEHPQPARRLIDTIDHLNAGGCEVGLILSSHDFERRPVDLLQRIEAMTNEPACTIIKVAWTARSLRDNLEAFALLRDRKKPTIALCMGEFGLMSRVLAGKFGGFMTYAAESHDTKTAPGQPTIDELRRLYRFDSIGPETKVYGVIGWPVGHSLSPKLHNAGFDSTGHDGVYLPLPIPPEYEHFKATVGELLDDAALDFRGASVTIPHKENLIRFVKEREGSIEPIAGFIGAANTLTIHDDGMIDTSNSDCPAAIQTLCTHMDIDHETLAGKSVAMLGAGGVARAIVAGLSQLGMNVTIFNRTRQRAEALAAAFSERATVSVGEMTQLGTRRFDIYINGTPLGMAGSEMADESPLPPDAPLAGAVVMDTVYNPVQTPLIRQAEAAGAQCIDGLDMFVRQAGTQFKQWTGHALPVDVIDASPTH